MEIIRTEFGPGATACTYGHKVVHARESLLRPRAAESLTTGALLVTLGWFLDGLNVGRS